MRLESDEAILTDPANIASPATGPSRISSVRFVTARPFSCRPRAPSLVPGEPHGSSSHRRRRRHPRPRGFRQQYADSGPVLFVMTSTIGPSGSRGMPAAGRASVLASHREGRSGPMSRAPGRGTVPRPRASDGPTDRIRAPKISAQGNTQIRPRSLSRGRDVIHETLQGQALSSGRPIAFTSARADPRLGRAAGDIIRPPCQTGCTRFSWGSTTTGRTSSPSMDASTTSTCSTTT